MTPDMIVTLGKETIWLILLIGAPMLGFGLLVGLVVSIIQAVTQVHEMTLTFVPKIVVVLLAFMLFSPWMLKKLVEFTERLFINIPLFIG